jgi:hypothetical protein
MDSLKATAKGMNSTAPIQKKENFSLNTLF